jgi:GNAT superfamily N-acetyltransferase
MSSEIEIVKALPVDADKASAIMNEAAGWLAGRGETLWFAEELTPERLMPSIHAGELYLVVMDGEPAGTVIFQLSDKIFWPDMPEGDSAYIHKVILKRSAAGRGIGRRIIEWARKKAKDLGMKFLRLDTEAARPKLCALYESAGFARHSERQVGRHYVVRYEMSLDG